jgi:transposase
VKRADFRAQIKEIDVAKLVFLDECGFALNLHRFYGWAPKAERCFERVPLNKCKNRSVLGAYGWPCPQNPTGLWALGQCLGAWNGALFEQFVEEALLPQLSVGSVLVMDNARIHHRQTLHEIIEAAGCRIVYLPPYSPDFNPIELVWSWLKDRVRLLAPRTDEHRQQTIQESALLLPAQAANGWFQLCGIL